jgi:hypothetical protein
MQIDLSDEESRTLREILHDFLPDLQREVSRTEAHDMRRHLLKRQELCERLMAQLDRVAV